MKAMSSIASSVEATCCWSAAANASRAAGDFADNGMSCISPNVPLNRGSSLSLRESRPFGAGEGAAALQVALQVALEVFEGVAFESASPSPSLRLRPSRREGEVSREHLR